MHQVYYSYRWWNWMGLIVKLKLATVIEMGSLKGWTPVHNTVTSKVRLGLWSFLTKGDSFGDKTDILWIFCGTTLSKHLEASNSKVQSLTGRNAYNGLLTATNFTSVRGCWIKFWQSYAKNRQPIIKIHVNSDSEDQFLQPLLSLCGMVSKYGHEIMLAAV